MYLVDTSVWIEVFRRPSPVALEAFADLEEVVLRKCSARRRIATFHAMARRIAIRYFERRGNGLRPPRRIRYSRTIDADRIVWIEDEQAKAENWRHE